MVESGSLHIEAVEGRGEDAPPLVAPSVGAVFDGLGGAGGATLRLADGRSVTNAYAASRVACRALAGFVEERAQAGAWERWEPAELAGTVGRVLLDALDGFHAGLGRPRSGLSSSLVLPTTCAVGLCDEHDDTVTLTALWAGDSRVYALDADGVHQVSQDDQAGQRRDYRELLLMDAPMDNKVNLSVPFHVNVRRIELRKPCVVLTCSDGCCMYFAHPLQLEYRWLQAFGRQDDLPAALDYLRRYYAQTSQDDCSLTAHVFAEGYGQLREMLAGRFAAFKRDYGRIWDREAELRDARAELARTEEALRPVRAAAERAWADVSVELRAVASGAWLDVAGGLAEEPRGVIGSIMRGLGRRSEACERAVRAQHQADALNRYLAWCEAGGADARPARVPVPPFVARDRARSLIAVAVRAESERVGAQQRRDIAGMRAQAAEAALRSAIDGCWCAYRFPYERHFSVPAEKVAPLELVAALEPAAPAQIEPAAEPAAPAQAEPAAEPVEPAVTEAPAETEALAVLEPPAEPESPAAPASEPPAEPEPPVPV